MAGRESSPAPAGGEGAQRARHPAVVLVRPQEQGNVGATARAMANMGFQRLILVEPAVEIGPTARAFAVKAGHLLDAALRVGSLEEAIAPFPRVIGTSAGTGRTSRQPVLDPRQLARWLNPEGEEASSIDACVVFGPESTGLNSDELALCGRLVQIPSAPEQPSLNLGQAVLILAYEIHLASGGADRRPAAERAEPAETAQVAGLLAQARDVLEVGGFARDDTFEGTFHELRSLAARSELSEREVSILRGVCRRILHALRR